MSIELKKRTQNFAIEIWKLCDQLPNSRSYNAYCRQLIRCSSSVGANYRAALRGKSKADFINKLKIVEEEADECMYFLEILAKINKEQREIILKLHKEANEILSIIVASIRTARKSK